MPKPDVLPREEEVGENIADEERHQMATPEEAEPVDVAIKRKHVLLALGGLVVGGIIIFASWEFVRHRLRKRRMERITSNMSSILRSSADVMHEMRKMSEAPLPLPEGPIPEQSKESVLQTKPQDGPEGFPSKQVKMPGNEMPTEVKEGLDGVDDNS